MCSQSKYARNTFYKFLLFSNFYVMEHDEKLIETVSSHVEHYIWLIVSQVYGLLFIKYKDKIWQNIEALYYITILYRYLSRVLNKNMNAYYS